ncbi:bifunctional 3-phosphoshikimate 1-carboxyvinyltransferase/cytidylate kinase [Curvibacter sp. RS43]|uniref:Multifunctional fusion protein n=1 Tax=Curvibacter microcysteis TaxID=3026419 RepID=A0ABT5MFL8_9BURK|nr:MULTISPECIES: bifunctional 3-phosphoshikimate 1-carboxyvinyltransferase/cytidylate kinase [unclassified Curvibacter]MDD0808814.1 bifunctional 3-phosphoshikimate 1-carboxyvinyltransferase/cytidylate kinase [Curvibacter sp. RS43]MDD0815362.1 bifunctional 3-phosphoshikimate 1-carboxyvinyltransferase/cytidylate kinase [Curvibacter sp. HBC28]
MFQTEFLDLPALASAGGSVTLPGSKSISNRVLLLAALSAGSTRIHDLLDSDDTRVMLQALRQLGCGVHEQGSVLVIDGLGGQLKTDTAQFFMGNAGTAMRPLTAALAVLGGDFSLSGVPRMHERPIGDLVDALRELGCSIDYLGNEGYPPLHIGRAQLRLDQAIPVRGDVSSQFLTALLMALPLAATQDIVIEVVGELISKPYIDITLNLLQRFGIAVRREGWARFTIPAGSRYQSPGDIHVEADASSASYFIALGALATPSEPGAKVRIQGVGLDSIQGDIRFVEAAQAMGAQITGGPNWLEIARGHWPLKAIDLDCNHIPDAAMTLAVMALYADGPCTLRNIASWRVKETDRIAAMVAECAKLGAQVEEGPDWLRVHPLPAGAWRSASIHTYDDHRVAMCFSLAAFNPDQVTVRIEDPKCVAKTFPDYFETLFGLVQAQPGRVPVICIDGPTASGKGTVAAEVAKRLGYHFLDSGAMYRVTALAATRAGLAIEPSQEAAIAALARALPVRFEDGKVLLGADDVTEAIRTEEAGMNASRVSALPSVRLALVDLQHGFQALPGLVADGRDMGTVIFPNAPYKVYMTASAACRAERRYKQLISKGISANISELRADLEARDARDQSRAVAPLKPAADAQWLDNSELSIDQSVQQVLAGWLQRQAIGSHSAT